MKKSVLFISIVALASALLICNQPSPSIAAETTPSVGKSNVAKPVITKKEKKKKNSMGKKNPSASRSTGRCDKPDDLDAKGKRCGNRASSVKKGGR
jgi:hypothetical protein